MKNKTSKRKSKNKTGYVVCELPSNNADLERYVEEHRKEINETLVDNIEYALKHRLGGIEVFCFKKSNFVVVLNRKDFAESLEDILTYSLEHEHYEICARIKKMIGRAKKMSYVFTFKNKNKHEEKKQPPEKN